MALAFAVLCCPYLAAVYVVYSVAAFVHSGKNKGTEKLREQALVKTWWYVTLGVAAVCIVFAAVLLTGADIYSMLRAIPNILNDPEHNSFTLGEKLWYFVNDMFIVGVHLNGEAVLTASLTVFMMLIFRNCDKRWQERRWIYLLVAGVVTIWLMIDRYYYYKHINMLNYPLCYAGACCYILSEKRDKKMFRLLYMTGWMYALAVHLGSNNNYHSMTMGLAVANIASAIFVADMAVELWREEKAIKRITAAVLLLAMATQVGIMGSIRANECFANVSHTNVDKVEELTYTIEQGVAKGLRVTDDEYAEYNAVMEDTQPARDAEGDNVLYYSADTWLYLADDKHNAGYSAWLSVLNNEGAVMLLFNYWKVNPDKIPDTIYISKSASNAEWARDMLNVNNLPVTETACGYLLQ